MARVLRVPEVARLMHVSTRTAYSYLRAGKIPGRRIGQQWLVPEDQLLSFLAGEQQERDPESSRHSGLRERSWK
jgi:excisionase family DNA binding protein